MPKTSRRLTVHPLTLWEVEAVWVVDLTPGMRRITLSGEQVCEFTSANGFPQPASDSPGVDDDIRLMFRHPGRAEPVQQEKGVDQPRNPRPLSKVSTVRRWHSETGELDVDFVRHGVGVGTSWAYRAQVGDRIYFYGPSASCALPQDTDWLPVAGDDTAIPAIARLLGELPDNARAQVFISRALKALPDPGGRVPLLGEVFETGALDEHDGEADLIGLAVYGSVLRTTAELDSVITRAGLVHTTTYTVGWGTTVHELVPAGTR